MASTTTIGCSFSIVFIERALPQPNFDWVRFACEMPKRAGRLSEVVAKRIVPWCRGDSEAIPPVELLVVHTRPWGSGRELRVRELPSLSTCVRPLAPLLPHSQFRATLGPLMGQPELDLSGQIIDQRFRVERRLGAGGMGTVWRVQHVQSLQYFALKTLRVSEEMSADAIQRCLKEARVAATLRSRHVVQITDVQPKYEHNGTPLPYLVMELLVGFDFEAVLMQRGSLTVAETVWTMRQLCRGIQFAHEHGIAHRDLKPANLFLTADDEGGPVVKICDFGLAKVARESPLTQSDGSSTQTGLLLGTPRYMAPEQLRGVSPSTITLDQWAIGLIAYRLLSGEDYFGGPSNGVELSLRIVHEKLPRPSRCSGLVPRSFDAWFFRSCCRDAGQRFPSVKAQVIALLKALGNPRPIPLDPSAAVERVARCEGVPHDSTSATVFSGLGATNRQPMVLYMALGISAATSIMAIASLAPRLASLREVRTAVSAPGTTALSGSMQSVRLVQKSDPLREVATQVPSSAGLVSNLPAITPAKKPATAVKRPRPLARANDTPEPSTPQAQVENVNLEPGSLCTRSYQCASHLCVAERCR
jgi:serine/threonine protein kinase